MTLPSCGRGQIYDGTYTRRLISGDGVTAQLLEQEKIPVFGETSCGQCLEFLETFKTGEEQEK